MQVRQQQQQALRMYILQQIHSYSLATPRWHAPRHSQEGAHNSSQRSGVPLQCDNLMRTAQRISSACNTHAAHINTGPGQTPGGPRQRCVAATPATGFPVCMAAHVQPQGTSPCLLSKVSHTSTLTLPNSTKTWSSAWSAYRHAVVPATPSVPLCSNWMSIACYGAAVMCSEACVCCSLGRRS